ncbi:MAG TPA: YCF48-related protein [Ignavibacteria bacterium]|nr:YCF48-related protein [Ignavibacteria bacterium]
MKYIKIIILISPFFNSLSAQYKLNVEVTNYNVPYLFYDVKFLNSQTGFICGEGGSILRTTNSGLNWIYIFPGYGDLFRSIYISEKQNNIFICGTSGRIIKSTNLGNSWTSLNSSLDIMFTSISGIDENKIIVCSEDGYVYKSENGGENFEAVLVNENVFFTSVKYLTNENIFVAGLSGKMFKSIDLGKSWKTVNSNTDKNIHSLYFLNSQTGYFAGLPGNIFKTIDGGNSWQFQNSNISNSLRGVHFYNQNNGFVVGYTTNILWTTTGGNNWLRHNISGTENILLNSVFMINDSVSIATGYNGLIVRSTIQKDIDTTINPPIENFTFNLFQNYPNPFNAGTKIKFDIAREENYKLKIYNLSGKLIFTKLFGILTPGSYDFNFLPDNLSSGVYVYELSGSTHKSYKKLVYIK